MTSMKYVAIVLLMATSLALGLACLFRTEQVQAFALRMWSSRNPLHEYMKTRDYFWSLRFVGVMHLAIAVVLSMVLFGSPLLE